MMYLILILVIAVVSRSHPEIGKLPPTSHKRHPLLFRHAPVLVSVQQTHYLIDHIVLALFRDVVGALVLEPVCRVYLIEVPVPAGVEIVQLEEGAAVEVGDMMLIWKGV